MVTTVILGHEEEPLEFWGRAPPRALVNLRAVDVETGEDWIILPTTKARLLPITKMGEWKITVDPATVPPSGYYHFQAVAHRLLIWEVGRSLDYPLYLH